MTPAMFRCPRQSRSIGAQRCVGQLEQRISIRGKAVVELETELVEDAELGGTRWAYSTEAAIQNAGESPRRAKPRLDTIALMFIEVIGQRALPDHIDRDDIEDLLTDVLDGHGEVTGAGTGMNGWHLDLDVTAEADQVPHIVKRLAAALVNQELGWILLRVEGNATGHTANDLI